MAATVGGYQLVQRVAVGGMAEIFLARKPGPEGLAKRVAIKRILPHLSKLPDFVAMFLEEARLVAGLDHPHIVHIHDFGVDHGSHYLAMEYVCGEDVQAILRRAHERSERLPVADVVTVVAAACEALHHAHQQGIVHRDVTPANLLISYEGVVKLADFGIAKAEARAARTQVGTLKGKIPYMSPEQALGQALDRRSDVFSLGVCAWEMFSGQRRFHGRSELEMLLLAQQAEVLPLRSLRPEVPAALDAVLERALAPDREARWPTAAAFGEALVSCLATLGQVPSVARLAETMTRLFGAHAAERRLAALRAPSEPTAGRWPLHPERWIPETAMHLHLPPPRLRLFLPLLALLVSGGGLLFGLRSHYARHALPAAVAPATVAPAPPASAEPRPGRTSATTDRQRSMMVRHWRRDR